MITKERLEKAKWSIKNEGTSVFIRKFIRFIPWAIVHTHIKYSKYLPRPLQANNGKYGSDYLYLKNSIFNINSTDLIRSQEIQELPNPKNIRSATWFVPYFDHLSFGGIQTIFRFINYFAENGISNHIVIYDNPQVNLTKMHEEIKKIFPNLSDTKLSIYNPSKDKIEDLPPTDIGICTFWVSAYFLLRFNQTKHKYYFIQDYEPLFYEAGSTYALAESTYRFGFEGIVNTSGLLKAVNQRYGLHGISFTPAVDPRYYYPPKQKNNKRLRIFFYARPNNPRNAFNLGVMTMKALIKKYGKEIEIVTAGSNWKEKKFDLKGGITNLGLLNSLQEVGDLYRSCDIGFVYMLSKHPSYQPFEFMACGMATVTNRNEDNLWFFRDNENCLLSEPSPGAMAETIGRLIENEKLRNSIAINGGKNVNFNWQPELKKVWDYVNS